MSTEQNLTGYPSIDKPWLKYYSEEQIKAEIPNMTAYEYLKKLNADRLEYPAIDSEVGNYTYKELFKIIDKTAASLYKMGIKKGKKILTMLPVLPHEVFLFYGVDVVGAALCQLPPQYTCEEVCKAIKKFDAELFFVFDCLLTEEMEKAVYENESITNIIVINPMTQQSQDERTLSWESFIKLGDEMKLPEINRDPSDLLFLASTGGSTGEPKSVMLNDNCFNVAVHQSINSDLDFNEKDRWMRLWPLFSATAAVSNNHLPLCIGMHMLLRQFPLEITEFDKMVVRDRPNHLMMIPQLFEVLEKSEIIKNMDLSFVKSAGCGGVSITREFEERVNRFFKEHNIKTILGYGWGLTENASSAAIRSNLATTDIGTVGAPLVKTVVSVFDTEENIEKEYGEEGEFCIKSPTLMMGYYNDSEITSDVLKTHSDGSVWLHTGDLGTINEEGIITVKGRMTRMIFVFPTAKIYPQAIENELSKISGVREVVVCETPDTEHDGFFLPVCFIIPETGYTEDGIRKNIQDYCKEAFPEYSRPKKIFVKSKFPLTKVGKPDILALEKEAQATIAMNE